jgi:hypothetical protein
LKEAGVPAQVGLEPSAVPLIDQEQVLLVTVAELSETHRQSDHHLVDPTQRSFRQPRIHDHSERSRLGDGASFSFGHRLAA